MDTKAVLDSAETEGSTSEKISPILTGIAVAVTGALVFTALAAVAVNVFGWYDIPSFPDALKALSGPSLGEVLLQGAAEEKRPQLP